MSENTIVFRSKGIIKERVTVIKMPVYNFRFLIFYSCQRSYVTSDYKIRHVVSYYNATLKIYVTERRESKWAY
jgi:hypothetical protein